MRVGYFGLRDKDREVLGSNTNERVNINLTTTSFVP